eukprot:g21863.t1
MQRICVFCGSRTGDDDAYRAAASQLGTRLAEAAIGLVFGGGSVGLMGVIADAVLAVGGEVVGVIPEMLATKEVQHPAVADMRLVPDMHARKALMAELSDAFIALPGGYGTFEELFEVVTWAQLGIHRKNIGLLNIGGFFDPLCRMIDHAIQEGFVRPDHRELFEPYEVQPMPGPYEVQPGPYEIQPAPGSYGVQPAPGCGTDYGANCQTQPFQPGYLPNFPYAIRTCRPCAKFGDHQTGLFGEILYLTARDANVPYASPVDGLGANAVPLGSIGVLDPDYETGFRAGFWWKLSQRSSIGVQYMLFESETSHGLARPGGTGFLRAELVHPNTTNVANDSLSARASHDIDFDFIDVDFKRLIYQTDNYAVNYVLGIRYAGLNQDLDARYTINGSTVVQSQIDFDGLGSRAGLTGDWMLGKGFHLYGSGFLNFLAGQFNADFRQSNVFGGLQAATGYEDDRIVAQLETEIGIGWRSCCGRFRLAAGYYSAVWFNTITTHTYLSRVRSNNYTDMSDSLTFDGMTARVEIRW